MAIKLQCECGKALSVKDEYAGRRVKCPACQMPLRVSKPQVEKASSDDEWDLGDLAENGWDDEPKKTREKSRGGKSSPTGGSNSRRTSLKVKRKTSQPSNRGILIGFSAGGGLLVVGLLAWMLWPAKPGPNVAVAPSENTARSPSMTSNTNSLSVILGSQPNPGAANPAAPSTNTTATKLEGDLKFLQGTWQVADIGLPPDTPRAAEMIAQMNLVTFTIKDDLLSITFPGGGSFKTIKLDSLQTPKTIDSTPLGGSFPKQPELGIYSIEGETWRMCSSMEGTARPQEMKAAPGQLVFTLQRSSAPPADPASSFDIKAWLAAESQLKAMKVLAQMLPWDKSFGIEGPTHVVMIDPPETADGTMSPELWAIVSSISHVFVRTTFVTDATLRQLAQHRGLLAISMNTRSAVTADGVGALKACQKLRALAFTVPVSPDMCGAISQLDQLRTLAIHGSPVSKEMLNSIVRLNQLESLSLGNTRITDDGLLQIQTLAKLKSLSLNHTNVTDQSLKTLSSLLDLESLNLSETKVTDAGMETLKSFKKLKSLSLQETKVTDEGLAELKQALPNCGVFK